MGNLSINFNREEFECKCGCGFNAADYELVQVLEQVREFFDEPIIITSGCRCDDHNRKIGGAYESKHKLGIACDFKVRNIEPERVYILLDHEYPTKYGLGLYNSWVHLDVRKDMARWNKTNG